MRTDTQERSIYTSVRPAILARPDGMLFAEEVAADSLIRFMSVRNDHVLFRPYSPRGMTTSGLWLERNPHHPKIWGWLLAVSCETSSKHPSLVPGCTLVVRRAQGETIAYEAPAKPRYLGHKLPVVAVPLDAIQLAISPALVRMNAA